MALAGEAAKLAIGSYVATFCGLTRQRWLRACRRRPGIAAAGKCSAADVQTPGVDKTASVRLYTSLLRVSEHAGRHTVKQPL